MNEKYSALRSNVSMLGHLLGNTIKDAHGEVLLEKVETIRKLSKSALAGNQQDRESLIEEIKPHTYIHPVPPIHTMSPHTYFQPQHTHAYPANSHPTLTHFIYTSFHI